MDKQTDRLMDKQTDRLMDKQTDRLMDKQMDRPVLSHLCVCEVEKSKCCYMK